MKRFISGFLILCMFMQIIGCYSTKYLSQNDINSLFTDETINIKANDGREFIVKPDITINEIEKNPSIGYCSDWQMKNDELYLLKNKVEFTNQKDEKGITIKKIGIDTLSIPRDLIGKISIDQFDSKATWYLASSIICIGIIAVIYFRFKNSNDGFKFNLFKKIITFF